MSDIPIRGGKIAPITSVSVPKDIKSAKDKGNFASILKEKFDEINRLQVQADEAIEKLEINNSGSIHEAIIALEKADISFRTMMQMRNKIVEAYQEIMRMQL